MGEVRFFLDAPSFFKDIMRRMWPLLDQPKVTLGVLGALKQPPIFLEKLPFNMEPVVQFWWNFFVKLPWCPQCCNEDWNGPKTNTKILWFLKTDQRRIRRIFVKSKILRRSSNIAKSSNIFEDTKIFKRKWKIFVVKNFLPDSNLNKFSQQ